MTLKVIFGSVDHHWSARSASQASDSFLEPEEPQLRSVEVVEYVFLGGAPLRMINIEL
jgi:hypothetical protein